MAGNGNSGSQPDRGLVQRGGQGVGAGSELGPGRSRWPSRSASGSALCTSPQVAQQPPVRDQARDVRPDRGDLLDELLNRLECGHRPAAVRAAGSRAPRRAHRRGRGPARMRPPGCPGGRPRAASREPSGTFMDSRRPERGGLAGRGPPPARRASPGASFFSRTVCSKAATSSAQRLVLLLELLQSRPLSRSHGPPHQAP